MFLLELKKRLSIFLISRQIWRITLNLIGLHMTASLLPGFSNSMVLVLCSLKLQKYLEYLKEVYGNENNIYGVFELCEHLFTFHQGEIYVPSYYTAFEIS